MIRTDYHIHTDFCDGRDSPERIVEAALRLGCEEIGFSAHSYTAFDDSYCLKLERYDEYRAEIAQLRQKYAGRISILCGIEQDVWSSAPTEGFDYVIGSVHYLKLGEEYLPVDESRETFCAAARRWFGGDYYALAEEYYKTAAELAERSSVDIIGHLDLVTKFNEGGRYFDEHHPRYVAAYRAAIDRLVPLGKPFEINSGAISRGYRTTPYPGDGAVEYISALGGEFILSSDSHASDTLCFEFDTLEQLAASKGLRLKQKIK